MLGSIPPSTLRLTPVMYPALGLTRNEMASAISSSVPTRPMGTWANMGSTACSITSHGEAIVADFAVEKGHAGRFAEDAHTTLARAGERSPDREERLRRAAAARRISAHR